MSRGFTLVELMVAIAIFAVLSALGWKVFDYVVKVKNRNAEHELVLEALQQSYQQIRRDSLHIVPINATRDGEIESALWLADNRLLFSKTGVHDPLQQGLAPHERIEYDYDAVEKTLYRSKYSGLHRSAQLQPSRSVLLTDVDDIKITALQPEPSVVWPLDSVDRQDLTQLQQLPKGLRIEMTYKGQLYTWLFLLTPAYLNVPDINMDAASAVQTGDV